MATLPFAPDEGDASVKILERIFGTPITNMVSTATQGDTQAMELVGALLNAFNLGLMIVAGIIASYIAIVGTANTANDGQALGKQWSSTWTPLRIVTAGAVLLPTASGYSFLQLFVIACALWGVNLANQVYDAALNHIFIAETMISHQNADRKLDFSIVQDLVKQKLCSRILTENGGKAVEFVRTDGEKGKWSSTERFQYKIGEYKTTGKGENQEKKAKNADCGIITYNVDPTLKDPPAEETKKDTSIYLAGLLQKTSRELRNELVQSRINLYKEFIDGSSTVVDDVVDSFMKAGPECFPNSGSKTEKEECLLFAETQTKIITALNYAKTKLYSTGTTNSFTKAQTDIVSAIVSDLSLGGWVMAPGWFQKVSSVLNSYFTSLRSITLPNSKAARSLPTIGHPKYVDAATLYAAAVDILDRTTEEYIKKLQNDEKARIETSSDSSDDTSQSTTKTWTLDVAKTRLGARRKELLEEAEGRISGTYTSLSQWVDNFPIWVISTIMPDYDKPQLGSNQLKYKTAKGSDATEFVHNTLTKVANAGKSVWRAFKLTFNMHSDNSLYDVFSTTSEFFQLCQKSVLGMGSSLFRVQCTAETALHLSDLIAGTTAKTVQTALETFGMKQELAKTLGEVAQDATVIAGGRQSWGVGMIADTIARQANNENSTLYAPLQFIGKRLEQFRLPLAFIAAGLPILPYFVFIFGVIGWVLGVLQAIIAAPLWACLHMTPGQSFIGSERQGYMLLLSLFIRPALLVLSLILAFWICDPLVEYYTNAFAEMILSGGPQSLMRDNPVTAATNVAGLLAGVISEPGVRLLLFFIGLMALFSTVFMLAQTLPNAVLKWLNMNVEDLGASHGADVLKSRTGRAIGSDTMGGDMSSAKAAGIDYTGTQAGRDRAARIEAAQKSTPIASVSY